MKERICRKDDESLYQPKIHSERIRDLYKVKVLIDLPMTVHLDKAIKEYCAKYLNPGWTIGETTITVYGDEDEITRDGQ